MGACSGTEGSESSYALLTDAVRRFSRSIELCDDYLRGYYGLKVVCCPPLCPRGNWLMGTDYPRQASQKLLGMSTPSKGTTAVLPSQESIQRLNEMATAHLQQLVDTWADRDSPAPKQSEIIAAKELLNRSQSP